jgi:hypothetical protein
VPLLHFKGPLRASIDVFVFALQASVTHACLAVENLKSAESVAGQALVIRIGLVRFLCTLKVQKRVPVVVGEL